MNGLLLAFCWAVSVRAQMTAPPNISDLRDAYTEAIDEPRRQTALAEIRRTPAQSVADVQALYDLFMRFPDAQVRDAALTSLQLADSANPQLAPLIEKYLEEPEPESVLFGLKGALRLRAPKALPTIEKIARRSFAFTSPDDAPLAAEKNAWWLQYEALAVLAQWQGIKSVPLIIKKSAEAPTVARVLSLYLWKEALPHILQWAESSSSVDKERAKLALEAPVPNAALRGTRAEMLRVVHDPKAGRELRHQLALKIGLCSTSEEIAALLQDYEVQTDTGTKLVLSAALFISRDRQIVPLLIRHLKESPNPSIRAGALVQLKDMLPAAEFRPLAQWAAANDADPDNKQDALRELKLLK